MSLGRSCLLMVGCLLTCSEILYCFVFFLSFFLLLFLLICPSVFYLFPLFICFKCLWGVSC